VCTKDILNSRKKKKEGKYSNVDHLSLREKKNTERNPQKKREKTKFFCMQKGKNKEEVHFHGLSNDSQCNVVSTVTLVDDVWFSQQQ